MPTRTRPALSRDAVADRALSVADEEGLEAVTIRRLAADLGVTPMALYWHFKTKDDLLAGVADRVLDGMVVPDETGAWADDLRAVLEALLTALRPHPHAAPLVPARMMAHPAGLDASERALRLLTGAGFSPETAADIASQALRTALSLVTSDRADAEPAADDALLRAKQAALAALPPDRYPYLVRFAWPMTHCDDVDRLFGLGVDLFVEGVKGLAPS